MTEMSADRTVALIPPGEGPSYWVVGDHITLKVTGKDTNGAFSVVETITAPQIGPPPHVHSREDETFYVLEGTFEFLAGDRTITATAGTTVQGPKGIPHTFRNVGATTGKLLVIASPAGFENFVAEVGAPAKDAASPPPPPGPAEIEQLVTVCRKYGIEILGSPPAE
jgi:quercetin dioxygenase-like cupin family protein